MQSKFHRRLKHVVELQSEILAFPNKLGFQKIIKNLTLKKSEKIEGPHNAELSCSGTC